MRRFWLGALVVLTACGNASRPGRAVEIPSGNAGRVVVFSDSLAARADTIDLGRIRAGEQLKQELLLRNDFPDALLILSVETSCGCTRVEFPRKPIQPAEQAPFSFTFDSRGFSGFQLKSITISTSASASRRLVLVGEVI